VPFGNIIFFRLGHELDHRVARSWISRCSGTRKVRDCSDLKQPRTLLESASESCTVYKTLELKDALENWRCHTNVKVEVENICNSFNSGKRWETSVNRRLRSMVSSRNKMDILQMGFEER
jgi:hypothetical protein